MVCSLERTHDLDPIPAVVCPILTPAKSEPLVLLRVVRSWLKTAGAMCL